MHLSTSEFYEKEWNFPSATFFAIHVFFAIPINQLQTTEAIKFQLPKGSISFSVPAFAFKVR